VPLVSPVYSGMPVRFRIWDVDDPSADDVGLPEAQCTWPLDCDEPTHSHFDSFADNRCNSYSNPYYTFEGGATRYVDASGQAEATIYAVSPHPGDNIRVTATTGRYTTGKTTWQQVDTGTGLLAEVKRSPILTTWRKLHLELDSMASGLDNPVSGKNIDDTWYNTPHAGESGAEIHGWNIHPDDGQYEGGVLIVTALGAPIFDIIDNIDDTLDDTV